MRAFNLNVNDQKGDFLESLTSASPAQIDSFPQGDKIKFLVTKYSDPDPDEEGFRVFSVKPWMFSQIRASLGYIDKTPDAGTFKLRVVGVGDTATLTFPAAQDAATITAWRTTVLTALNAVAGAGAARLDTPPEGAPAHFLYFTWTSPTDEREIQVVAAAFVPPIDIENAVSVTQGKPAFQQLVKLVRMPFLMAKDFAFPNAGAPEILLDRAGGSGVNAIQLIRVPSGAVGAFDLAWGSVHTIGLAVNSTLNASVIQDALNAVVVDGGSNPSFRVSLRSKNLYEVEFVGPLAGAVQPPLVATPRGDQTVYTAEGILSLDARKCERVLNGQPSVDVMFELVIVAEGGESTFLRQVKLVNDMTSEGTVASAEQQDAVLTIEKIIYVDLSAPGTEAFVEAAPGASFTPGAGGNALTITHALNTLFPDIRMMRRTSDDPEEWSRVKEGIFSVTSKTTGLAQVKLGVNVSEDPEDPWHFSKVKFFISSPDSKLIIYLHRHPAGQIDVAEGKTLVDALAEINARLGVVDGSLKVLAKDVDGQLTATQIDLTAVSIALAQNSQFAQTFLSMITNGDVITNIANALTNKSTFTTTLTTQIANNSTITNAIVTALTSNSAFTSVLQENIYSVLQGGAAGMLPVGATVIICDKVAFAVPAPQQIAGPSLARTVAVTTEQKSGSGDSATTTTKTDLATENDPTTLPVYAALAPAWASVNSGGTTTGKINSGPNGTIFTTTGETSARSVRGRRPCTFPSGITITCHNGFWYQVQQIGSAWYPSEYEQPLGRMTVDDGELFLGSRFQTLFPFWFQLLGNTLGRGEIAIDIGTLSSESPSGTRTWTNIVSSVVHFSPAMKSRQIGIVIERAANGTLTGSYTVQGRSTNFTPPAANFALRYRLTKVSFEVAGVADPRGSLSVTMPIVYGSIIAI